MPTADPSRPVFSIITVCRNAERTIGTTIESVRNQVGVGSSVEHIVIDGVSTDGTLRTLARYPQLRVVSEPDAGIYDAMNKGVALARGEYIAILNADDWYEPDALALVAAAFRERPEADVVHGNIRRWNRETPVDVVEPPIARPPRGMLLMPVHQPACFVKDDVFRRFGRFDLSYRLFADYDWMTRVLRGGAVLHYIPRVLTNFRIGGASTTRFSAREMYRVFRNNGAGILAALATVAYSRAVVLRNRLRRDS